jgi:hypothetical protein
MTLFWWIVLSWVLLSVPLGFFVGRCMALNDQPCETPEPDASERGDKVTRRAA